jgi:hypothetical protein
MGESEIKPWWADCQQQALATRATALSLGHELII